MKRAVPFVLILGGAVVLASIDVRAQEEGSIDIGDIGSNRIRGAPGLTRADERLRAAMEEEDVFYTEENLPKKGSKKRLPALHILAKRYYGGQQWKESCTRYDVIVDEEGPAGLDADKDGRTNAARSYLECAKTAFLSTEFDKSERLLKKSEGLQKSDYRHAAVRRKIIRERYRKKVSDGDINAALGLFKQYQDERKDEDERIWFGERLSERAWAAHKSKDTISRDEMMGHLETIAPMNTDYRRLKDQLDLEGNILMNALGLAAAVIAFVLLLGMFMKWRAAAKVKKFAGAGGKFDLDDEF